MYGVRRDQDLLEARSFRCRETDSTNQDSNEESENETNETRQESISIKTKTRMLKGCQRGQ